MTFAERVKASIIYQTDHRLDSETNRYGCRVMTLLAIPQFIAGEALTVDQVQQIIEDGRKIPDVIGVNMQTGTRENWLIDIGFETLGIPRRGRQVGWEPEHIATRKWEYMLAHWVTDGPDGHWTFFDRRQIELYDPWNPGQDPTGYVINKRRVDRKLIYHTWEV